MVKDVTTEDASAGSLPEGTSCKGLLYLSSSSSASSSRKSTAHNPLCLGLSRPQDRVHSVGKSEEDVAKHGKALRDFKYACMGYSVYRNEQAATSSMQQSDKRAELPSCTGIEMFAEGQAPEVTGAASQGHLNRNSHRNNEGPPIMSRPPSAVRPIRGVSPEEFSTKFIRSAGVVAAAIKDNLSRVGRSIKEMVGDIIHPDGSRPK